MFTIEPRPTSFIRRPAALQDHQVAARWLSSENRIILPAGLKHRAWPEAADGIHQVLRRRLHLVDPLPHHLDFVALGETATSARTPGNVFSSVCRSSADRATAIIDLRARRVRRPLPARADPLPRTRPPVRPRRLPVPGCAQELIPQAGLLVVGTAPERRPFTCWLVHSESVLSGHGTPSSCRA